MPRNSRVSIREMAIAKVAEHTNTRKTWLLTLSERDQETASELASLIVEWFDGGEIRALYPTRSALSRFLATLDCVPLLFNGVQGFLDRVAADEINLRKFILSENSPRKPATKKANRKA